jgi:hypothetical protein
VTVRGALAAIAALAFPAAAQAQPAPFVLADVGFTPDCNPNPALGRLFTLFVPRPPADEVQVDFDEPLYNAVSGNVSQTIYLDDPADWHGLHLTEVRFFHGIERGPVNYSHVFADPPESVREVWNRRGWRLPAVGALRDVEGLEGYASIGVEADGDLATVTCYRD